MREEMASTAEKRGRSKEIARGMVDEELTFTHLVIGRDSIKVDDIIIIVESEKASMEIPSNFKGKVKKINVKDKLNIY